MREKVSVLIGVVAMTLMFNVCNCLSAEKKEVKIQPLLPESQEAFYGARIQRTMTLLATSNERLRRKVKILFYGQSIVGQSWFRIIEKNLRERFPNADLVVENRAIGGYTAPSLVRTAVHDLYPIYPDLVVFHVYGGEWTGELERIFYNIRKYTTAEILTFTHHSHAKNDREKLDDISSDMTEYLAQKYNCELVNVRREWKRYLKHYNIKAQDLLGDSIHPNSKGGKLMAELILKHFRFNPLFSGGWFNTVKTYEARRFIEENQDEIQLKGDGWINHRGGIECSTTGNSLKLKFKGNRIDVVAASSNKKLGTAKVLIDGKSPSQFPEIYYATRPTRALGVWWPAINRVTLGTDKEPVVEDWVLKITEISDDAAKFSFVLEGSVTGKDGSGTNYGEKSFVSNSGRIRFLTKEFSIKWAQKYSKKKCPVGFEVKWSVRGKYIDIWKPKPVKDRCYENFYTLVQGLKNTEHSLEIIPNGDGVIPIKAIRVYTPPIE